MVISRRCHCRIGWVRPKNGGGPAYVPLMTSEEFFFWERGLLDVPPIDKFEGTTAVAFRKFNDVCYDFCSNIFKRN